MPPVEDSKVTCAEETEEENIAKKIKRRASDNTVSEVKIETPLKVKNEKCVICKQYLNNAILYKGHPNNSTEEFVALTDEKLSLYTGKEEFVDSSDDFPMHKITQFTVYDKRGHLCAFDSGLIESNVFLYFSGYIKAVYEEDPNITNGIPAHDMGPINEWWTEGYDGGEKLPLGFSTEYAQYYLMDPSPEYQPFLDKVLQKTKLSKIVIEFLIEHSWDNPSYEDLVQHIENIGKYPNVEDTLIQHAQFVCDQLVNFEQNANEDDNEKPLISLPCMRSLVNLSGVTFQKRTGIKKVGDKGLKIKAKKRPVWTKAVTTNLVQDVFENFFPEQIDNKNDPKGPKKKRCGICEGCQSPDCGTCSHCKDMLKFGGSGRSKQACKNRKCPNMAIIDAELSDNEGENDDKEVQKSKKKSCSKKILHKSVSWGEKSERKYKGNKCFASATVDDIKLQPGDFVTLKSENPNEPLCVIQIVYMYDMPLKPFMFHGLQLCRGNETILGETSDPRELFLVDDCDDFPLGSIVRKAEVEYKKPVENWHELGGELHLPQQLEDNGLNFFCSKRYDSSSSRFVDLKEFETEFKDSCISCKRISEERKHDNPIYNEETGSVGWHGDIFKVGTGVFLTPDTYSMGTAPYYDKPDIKENLNEEMYPEYYRKKSDNIKGSNADTPEAFIVGLIEGIEKQKTNVKLKVRIFYRPENIANSMFRAHVKDLNFVYWTEEIITTSFDDVRGKCYIEYGANLECPFEWTQEGPHRFYFTDAYCTKTKEEVDLPSQAKRIGTFSKGKGGGKIKGKGKDKEAPEPLPVWGTLDRPLRCMDVFAGCGGLSEGLHQAGIAETKWAIEIDQSAAQAFRLNNPNCKVFSDDCNHLLKTVLNGEGKTKGLPTKGDVEMLVGGPPCQGFSGMNRFNAGQYSLFKNSLVVSYLSYCEYYRPKYFILENVRNFVSFKRSMVLKLTVRCLLAMGYQVTFGILQAGHYGVPQTRRRLILMAAAPGYVLPKYPEPQYVFNRRGTQLSFVVDNFKYQNGNVWTESAPYRTICVRDAMSDLPDIKNGWNKAEMPYDCDALTYFQKMIRKGNNSDMVKDHVCKEMSSLVEARMSQVPTYPGADWRDLPNISLRLNDGTTTNILNYSYRLKKQKKDEKPKGVCQCATGQECNPLDRQFNTLIPWCLPHTGDRHNHWAGLYGRLEWDGFFGTTITNPEPMGKQGRVLHPEQNRVVSVRECARSQGFPDKFQFYGNILDKHRQVGNAVPPPLGAALGKEIKKALLSTGKLHLPQEKVEKVEDEEVKIEF